MPNIPRRETKVLRIPVDLHEEIKVQAARSAQTMSKLAEAMLRQQLQPKTS